MFLSHVTVVLFRWGHIISCLMSLARQTAPYSCLLLPLSVHVFFFVFSAAWVSVEGCLSDEIETSTGRVTLDCLIAALQSPVLGLRLRPRLLALAVSCEAVFLLDAGSEEQFTSGDSTVFSSYSIKSGCCRG